MDDDADDEKPETARLFAFQMAASPGARQTQHAAGHRYPLLVVIVAGSELDAKRTVRGSVTEAGWTFPEVLKIIELDTTVPLARFGEMEPYIRAACEHGVCVVAFSDPLD